jgi:protein O-GlcNAc transferase
VQALESQARALALAPGHPFALGDRLGLKAQACDWTDLPEEVAALEDALRRGRPVIQPFATLGLIDDPALQRAAAEIWCAARHPTPAAARKPRRARRDDDRIRVAYCSSDFHNHATSWLLAEVLESHDATRFECWGLCFGPPRDDDMRRRVAGALHGFVDISRLSDRDAAALARDIGIDIAVDLKGHALDARPGLFAADCAPVQVSYLGYPGTTGAPFIDYLIADETVVPPQDLPHYTEKVVYLPGCYQANDSRRRISPRAWSRAELGLPEDAFVYCCFNAPYKIMPAVFDAWMRVLRAVPRAVLWLYEDNEAAAANLRREAAARGVGPARLVFAQPRVMEEHLARYRCADLFLDTLPCNAHTTASDALWAGVPVLTLQGRSFAARVAASLLQALGLPELVAHSLADYEALAVALAGDRGRLRALALRLQHARHASGLFDGRRMARRLEAAYAAMHRRHLLGLPPAHLGPDGLPLVADSGSG